MKKILFILFVFIFSISSWAVEYAPVANLEYIHNAIANKYDISISYNPAVVDTTSIANMKYLLTAIDVANQMQGVATAYGDSEFATEYAANIITVDEAVNTLIKIPTEPEEPDEPLPDFLVPPYVFAIKTNDQTTSYSFSIAAKGTFIVDWGDGTVDTYNQTSTYSKTYSHTYATKGEKLIRFGGVATAYDSETRMGSISFAYASSTAEIYGSLGKIFPTLADGSQPSFYQTFYYNRGLGGVIPRRLFSGITGAPVSYMFSQTFYMCESITTLPEGLFGGLDGAPASNLFDSTFYACSSLQYIPANLFGHLYGRPAISMFYKTFQYCTGLTGEIPLGLFGDYENYYRSNMFSYTFSNCPGLTGPSARMPDGTFIYNYFTTGSGYTPMSKTYAGFTNLYDYANIPAASK